MGNTTMDKQGRILIPIEVRKKLCLRIGTEFKITQVNGKLMLKPIVTKPIRVEAKQRKWGKETFLNSGETTFSE